MRAKYEKQFKDATHEEDHFASTLFKMFRNIHEFQSFSSAYCRFGPQTVKITSCIHGHKTLDDAMLNLVDRFSTQMA